MTLLDSSCMSQCRLNPLAKNPFRTKQDVVAACQKLFDPLLASFSPGKARVQLDASGSTWDRAACDLEGFSRPLFGIAPRAAGGTSFAYWDVYRTGLRNGTDPSHDEFWGNITDMDQRHVEAAALGYGLLLASEHLWDPLDTQTKTRVAEWLQSSRNSKHANNNHKFFRVIVDLGLERVGISVNSEQTEEYLQDLETMYIGDGWYRDGADVGDMRRIDYYNAFAMHFYGLLYAVYRPQDVARSQRFRLRARKFALNFQHWFADDGAGIPFGRSLVYRHAMAALWGMLAVANEDPLPWGVMKGLYLRHLRWWAFQPISRLDDGLMTLGYAYPNQMITERYSSPGSPWWAMKVFAPLCLPETHPFWASAEMSMPERKSVISFPIPGMVFTHQPAHSVMLVSGPGTNLEMRGMHEKYNKFAYSSRYGFSIESDSRGFSIEAFDSMLALSDDGRHFRVRENCEDVQIANGIIFSRWYPWTDVTVQTWLIPHECWHMRVHEVSSSRPLSTIEGGFAVPKFDFMQDRIFEQKSSAWTCGAMGDFSGIVDASDPPRVGRVQSPHGNTNVMYPRTLVPQLQGNIKPNCTRIFASAILAGPDGLRMNELWKYPPKPPTVQELREKVSKEGVSVEIAQDILRTLGE
ncbi:hypothetical protein N7510_005264 [Penicillium lagena]|uniref:uncharacterized protein n=1 Tax=Penicillium lagena TaxID=94218 RepID=UPI00253FFD99|nr:uncharacterized protein N7510_005264 [Penicillium lagena]KAJ5612070.1 hypothetical protein N7510_005264 [Penicillium lagena]